MNQKNLDIEVLRGVAIVITMFAHLNLLFIWHPTWYTSLLKFFDPSVGVDLFFCISGYVITKSIFESRKNVTSFKAFAFPFWTKRVFRLWPTSFLWVLIYILCAQYLNWQNSFGEPIKTIYSSIAAIFHLSNLYFPFCVSQHNCGSNLIYWSLSLEEQFYLIFPLLVFYLSKKELSYIILFIVILQLFTYRAAASLLWCLRTDAISLGVLLALYSDKFDSIFKGSILSYLFLLCLFFALITIPSFFPLEAVVSIICALLVLMAISQNIQILADGIFRSIFIYIGSRSFSIYVIHEAVFRLIGEFYSLFTGVVHFDDSYTWHFTILAIIFCILISEINYKFIELPFRQKGINITNDMKVRLYRY